MNVIIENTPPQEILAQARLATTIGELKKHFFAFFNLEPEPDATSYKDEDSDYGLKQRGIGTREAINEKCKEIIARVIDPADLTEEERETLKQYSGKGGLTENSQWEYYTPAYIAQGIWDAMQANGFENGNVLEPSCGAGVFLGTKPAGVVMSANDLDETGSKIAALLNPGDSVRTSSFEDIVMSTDDDTFDSCVGNVPFGDARGASQAIDPAYNKEKQVEIVFST